MTCPRWKHVQDTCRLPKDERCTLPRYTLYTPEIHAVYSRDQGVQSRDPRCTLLRSTLYTPGTHTIHQDLRLKPNVTITPVSISHCTLQMLKTPIQTWHSHILRSTYDSDRVLDWRRGDRSIRLLQHEQAYTQHTALAAKFSATSFKQCIKMMTDKFVRSSCRFERVPANI